MIHALYRSLGSLRAWITVIIGAVAATATWRSPIQANAAAPPGAASSSFSHRKHTLPLLALLAAAALGLALLLPGGALQAQSNTIEYPEGGKEPVATFTADDPEGATSITWAVTTANADPDGDGSLTAADTVDADSFEIDEDGVLTFMSTPDYEASTTGDGGGDADNDNTYHVVVSASDGVAAPNTGISYHKVTVEVTDVDEPGKVTWAVDPDGAGTLDAATVNGGEPIMQFQVGATLTASVEDGDIAGEAKAVATPGATAPIWRWYKSSSMSSMGTLITGADAQDNTYTVGLDDVGMYIRVVAHYVVTGNVDQETAPLTSDYPVLAARVGANDLEFDPATVSRSVAEGDEGANVGAPVTAEGNHGAVNYVLTGTDAARFAIDGKTGQITTDAALDYEAAAGDDANCTARNSCEVTVTATDASGEASDPVATVTIKITDVDEKPTFSAGAEAVSVAENSKEVRADSDDDGDNDSDDTANPYTAADPEGRNLTYHLMGADGAKFQLSATRDLSFRAAPDYEMPGDANGDNIYEVTVRAHDGTMYGDRMVRVTVTGIPEAPDVMGPDSVDYAENGKDTVATFTADDPEGVTSIVWNIAGATGAPALPSNIPATDNEDSASFKIDEDGMLEFSDSPDYEASTAGDGGGDTDNDNTYHVVVAASDGTVEATDTETGFHKVTVEVTNVNEPGKVTWVVDPDGTGALDPTAVNGGDPIVQFQVGANLVATATDGDIAGSDKTVVAAQNPTWRWYRGGTQINGETTNAYDVAIPDSRSHIRVIATYRVGDTPTRRAPP